MCITVSIEDKDNYYSVQVEYMELLELYSVSKGFLSSCPKSFLQYAPGIINKKLVDLIEGFIAEEDKIQVAKLCSALQHATNETPMSERNENDRQLASFLNRTLDNL